MTMTKVRGKLAGLPVPSARNDNMVAGFMEVTPEIAATWLALRNTNNRHLNQNWVDKYQRDMEAGLWTADGMPIRFAGDFAQLLDGQHRLTAQAKADLTLTYLVVTGLSSTSQEVMDHGRSRSFADVLKLRGIPCSSGIAALVRSVDNYAVSGTPVSSNQPRQPSIAELLRRFEAHPGIPDGYRSQTRVVGMGSGMASATRYLTSLASPEDSAVFMRLLETGDGLSVGNPIHTLRERLAKEAANSVQTLPSTHRWVFVARAWNAWLAGEHVTRFAFRAGGAHPDRVPTLEGLNPEEVA